MGHMYPVELSKVMTNLGDTTLRECLEEAIEREIGVSCAEGVYYEQHMYEMAFETLLFLYDQKGKVSLLPETETQKEAVELMRSGKELRGNHRAALYETPFIVADDIAHIGYIEF